MEFGVIDVVVSAATYRESRKAGESLSMEQTAKAEVGEDRGCGNRTLRDGRRGGDGPDGGYGERRERVQFIVYPLRALSTAKRPDLPAVFREVFSAPGSVIAVRGGDHRPTPAATEEA